MTSESLKKLIGQKVVITNLGMTYSTFIRMFEKLGFKNKRNNPSQRFKVGDIVKVFNTDHEDGCSRVAVVNSKGEELLINLKGVVTLSQLESTYYSIGDRFRIDGEEYILTTNGGNDLLFVNLRKGTILSSSSGLPDTVNSLFKISESSFERILGEIDEEYLQNYVRIQEAELTEEEEAERKSILGF